MYISSGETNKIIIPLARAETAREKWRGKKWQHSECMGAMLGVDHEEYKEITYIGATIKTLELKATSIL